MEKEVFIFGIGDLAENLYYHLLEDRVKIAGFIVCIMGLSL